MKQIPTYVQVITSMRETPVKYEIVIIIKY